MGQISGDKSRYNLQRRKKIARRARMRALQAELGGKGAAPKARAATPSKSGGPAGT